MKRIPRTIEEASNELRAGATTSVELTEGVLDRADRFDEHLGAYLARFDEAALRSAARADAELESGRDRGPLHGIPVSVKDMLAAREGPTTAQSLVLDPEWGLNRDATVVSRLREAGAVITGKATTSEFACGLPDTSKPFPLPRNPWHLRAYPGGSSSGGGSGVASGLFLASLGTDTAGSIRIPAAWCGVTGLKPTFGRVPRTGCVPLGYSLDHIGPLARSARDCAVVFNAIAGPDGKDADAVSMPTPDHLPDRTGRLNGYRVGVDRRESFFSDADPELRSRLDDLIRTLGELGADVVEVTIPYWQEATFATMLILATEAATYHYPDLHNRWDDYYQSTRLLLGQGLLVTGVDYVQAQRVRRVAQAALAALFKDVDLVLLPTTATEAFFYDDDDELSELEKLVETAYTPYWDAVGNPVLAIPIGAGSNGLPLSAQLVGRPFQEDVVLQVGDAYQQRTKWHLTTPTAIAGYDASLGCQS